MSELDFGKVWAARPKSPIGDAPIELMVVDKRCVYVNNHRIAGSKPYVSEGLSAHTLNTTLGNILEAFPEADILAAIEEKRALAKYVADYHAAKATRT